MPHILVRHQVENFTDWKEFFIDHSPTRNEAGSLGGQVFRNEDNPNELFVLLEWDESDRAREFTSSEDLKKVMEESGVTDTPSITFLKEVARPTR